MKTVLNLIVSTLIILFAMSFNYYGGVTPWVAPKSADKLKNPLKDNATATNEGKKLYTQMCAVCHGPKGKGDGMAGAALNPRPSNFTSEKVQAQTDGAIYWKITEGRSPMASYKAVLKDNQRWQLVNYIRTFNKNKPTTKPAEKPIEKIEPQEEKARRLEKEANEKYTKLIVEADTSFAAKNYKAAKIQYSEALKIRPSDSLVIFKLNELTPLIVEAEKREILKKEIKKELKKELKEEIIQELKSEQK